ncbi:TonB-dependent receptor [Moraxella lacunata]|uniref:TonB-dependent receptor n=1 Tax=Moraxella lacunata TaxID=477 RepID=A0A1B8Q758_MORLA|nr:TonB-dependent receptor [Moraxella lacunata]OBX65625.1 TonB-dependent receptor [Moraxella lacunata]
MAVALSAQLAYADETQSDEPTVVLADETIYIERPSIGTQMTVGRDKLKHRSATLGNALAGELGIHSNPFGGGASKPIIRGQDGVRVKILQNGTDVIDMSALSPDHVVAADTLLASRVELVRGAGTLLYGTASQAGVVNVVDERIPSRMPQGNIKDNIEGETLLRYNTGSNERVATASLNMGVGQNVAVRVEGLTRRADDYDVPEFQSDVMLDYLPDSHNKSTVGTVGVSYIGDKGHIGVSYSRRQDKYGIPGHNHHYDSCTAHFVSAIDNPERAVAGRYYLNAYPHLMDDDDIVNTPHFDSCKVASNGEEHGHSHDNPFGFDHDHNHSGPWVDMKTDRYDLRGELNNPVRGMDKVRLSLTYADYFHDEKDPGNPTRTTGIEANTDDEIREKAIADRGHPSAIFTNKGFNSRLEGYHSPVSLFGGTLKGMAGVQYQTQKASATVPYLPSYGDTSKADPRYLLVPHTNKNFSVFALESFNKGNLTLEGAVRYERQKTPVHYDHELLAEKLQRHIANSSATNNKEPQHPDLSPYTQSAVSYAGTASWEFAPNYRLSATYSHNERLPAPMELYFSGKHLATNSFEYGNKDLTKEKSDNYELALSHTGDKVSYKGSAYYSDFDNYIFNENVAKAGNLYIRRYNQTTAKFYGLEGEMTFHVNPNHDITLFGDMVRGKIGSLAPVKGKLLHSGRKWVYFDDDIKEMQVTEDGFYDEDGTSSLTCADKTPEEWGQIDPDNECSRTINVYKNGTTTPSEEDYDWLERPATNAPRVPPMRLGVRWQGYFGDKWSANAEYSHVFEQDKISTSTIAIKPDYGKMSYNNSENPLTMQARTITENVTKGYNLLNLGLDYHNHWGNLDYTLSLRANNVLDEKVYIHNSFLPFVPQMGRNFSLSATVKF